MPHIDKSPIIYTISMVQFPRIPDMEKFADKFLNQIRHEYPIEDKTNSTTLNAEISTIGFQIQKTEIPLWQFSSVDRAWGFVLSESSLSLHTPKFENFSFFHDKFITGINSLLNLPEINIEWITMIGYRFVSIVNLTNHFAVGTSNLFPEIYPSTELKFLDGVYVTRFSTNLGELRIQSIKNPSFTLTPDLNNNFTIKNGWIIPKPYPKFALVDIDHVSNWAKPQRCDAKIISNVLAGLHNISQDVFYKNLAQVRR